MGNQENIDQLGRVKGLVKLCEKNNYSIPLKISTLKNVEELDFDTESHVSDPKLIANNLTNLKRIIFGEASIDDIIPFFRRSTEMQQIKVYYLLLFKLEFISTKTQISLTYQH